MQKFTELLPTQMGRWFLCLSVFLLLYISTTKQNLLQKIWVRSPWVETILHLINGHLNIVLKEHQIINPHGVVVMSWWSEILSYKQIWKDRRYTPGRGGLSCPVSMEWFDPVFSTRCISDVPHKYNFICLTEPFCVEFTCSHSPETCTLG